MYRRVKRRLVHWTADHLFELAALQVLVGVALWASAYVFSPGEPPVVLAMFALALVFSGWVGLAVAADADPDT